MIKRSILITNFTKGQFLFNQKQNGMELLVTLSLCECTRTPVHRGDLLHLALRSHLANMQCNVCHWIWDENVSRLYTSWTLLIGNRPTIMIVKDIHYLWLISMWTATFLSLYHVTWGKEKVFDQHTWKLVGCFLDINVLKFTTIWRKVRFQEKLGLRSKPIQVCGSYCVSNDTNFFMKILDMIQLKCNGYSKAKLI